MDASPRHDVVLRDMRPGGVLVLTLNRPQVLNALDQRLRRTLQKELVGAGADPAVRCIVITGSGRGFCAGADLREREPDRPIRHIVMTEYNPIVETIRNLGKPVVSAVNGVAAGAGMGLALAADSVVAASGSRFVPAFLRLGLVPDTGLTRTLVLGLGRHRAAAVLFGEMELDAGAACELGLVSRVVPQGDLLRTARSVAARLAMAPAETVSSVKLLVR